MLKPMECGSSAALSPVFNADCGHSSSRTNHRMTLPNSQRASDNNFANCMCPRGQGAIMSTKSCSVQLSALAGCLLIVGCANPAPFKLFSSKPRSDRKAPVDPPNSNSEWTNNAPQSMTPAADLQPEPSARPEDPLHYFTNKKLVPIRQPG